MSYFNKAKVAMVTNQLMTNKVTSPAVLEAFGSVDRHNFVEGDWQKVAYSDARIHMNDNRTLLAPDCLARMIQALDLKPSDKLMIVGCGTGYSIAITHSMCNKVVGVEADAELATKAANYISKNKIENVSILHGEYLAGAPADAAFSAILIDGAVEKCPKSLLDQLANNARLICIERTYNSISKVVMYENNSMQISRIELFDGFADFL